MSISTQCDELKRIPYQSDSAEHLSTMNSVAAASTTDEKHIDDTEEMSCCKKLGFTPIPRDKEDPRFIESFSSTSEHELQKALDFFNCYGFVVFKEVYSAEECERTRSSMWDIIEKDSPGFDRNDRETWKNYSSAGKYGLSMRGPCFHPTLVHNRQNPNLICALEKIIGSTDVMVSHDRFTIYRATKDEPSFATGDRNVHLDINPWWWCESSSDVLHGLTFLKYDNSQDFIKENNLVVRDMGRHVQCVLNFEDNVEMDGGTILVPRFHSHIDEWCRADDMEISEVTRIHNEAIKLEQQQKAALKKQLKEQRRTEREMKTLCSQQDTKRVSGGNVSKESTDSGCIESLHDHSKHHDGKKSGRKAQKHKSKPKSMYSVSGKWGATVQLRQPLPWVIMSQDSELNSLAQRIPMKEGSVLMWDQTMVHGTQPNNCSSRCRMAMFLKAFDRTKTFVGEDGEARRLRRRAALIKYMAEGVKNTLQPPDGTEKSSGLNMTCNNAGNSTENQSELDLLGLTQVGRRVFDI